MFEAPSATGSPTSCGERFEWSLSKLSIVVDWIVVGLTSRARRLTIRLQQYWACILFDPHFCWPDWNWWDEATTFTMTPVILSLVLVVNSISLFIEGHHKSKNEKDKSTSYLLLHSEMANREIYFTTTRSLSSLLSASSYEASWSVKTFQRRVSSGPGGAL